MTTAVILALDPDHAENGQPLCDFLNAKFPGVHFVAVVGLRSSVVFDYDGPEPAGVPAVVKSPTPTDSVEVAA